MPPKLPHPHQFKKKLAHDGARRRTHPLIWLLAIICTIIAVAVVIAGIVVFIGYLVIHPRVPVISVTNGNLDLLRNDYAGLMQTQITIVVRAQNGNAKAHATFSDIRFNLTFQGQGIAMLVADSFEVPKNSSRDLNYVVQSSSIPLTPDQMELINQAWKQNQIAFDLKGDARTQWRVGPLGSVKFACHLNCKLRFHPMNGTYIPSRCTSKSK
ncbi:NDR1/HIN1-like protein 12 [Neltuma alba]|uniref:NDR1/HIN1-like protein 12 n=1 Tax=Neltuma alba TaxID=207710 RepID=UPI0010A30024|nr:NDR1/HIN1-like protein 12 [Prosopis alba]XP_028795914.1 NDR1/HIN1-like protein 12 [Prosopis alba]